MLSPGSRTTILPTRLGIVLALAMQLGSLGCRQEPTCEGLDELATKLHAARRDIRKAERADGDLQAMVVQDAPKVYRVGTEPQDTAIEAAVRAYLDRSGGDKKGVWTDLEVERLRTQRNDVLRTFEGVRQEAADAVETGLASTRSDLEDLAARLDAQPACGEVDLTELWNLVDEAEDLARGEYRWRKQARTEETAAVVQRAVARWEADQQQNPDAGPGPAGDPEVVPWERPEPECRVVGLLTGRRVQVEKHVLYVDHEDYTVCDPSTQECDPDEAERQAAAARAVPAMLDDVKTQLEARDDSGAPRYHLIRTRVEDITAEWVESSVEASLDICQSMVDDRTGQELLRLRANLRLLLQIPQEDGSAASE